MSYVPLGVRSEYSFLDGLCRVEGLVERARALHLDAIGIADLHSTYGLVKFYVAARAAGIRPILGVRVRLLPRTSIDPAWGPFRPELVLLATDAVGYHNLLQVVSQAHLESGSDGAGVTLEDLARLHTGLLALDGGINGPLSRTLLQSGPAEAEQLAGKLREIFGSESFFLQLQRHGTPEESVAEPFMLRLGRALNIPMLAANETRFLDADDAPVYEVLRRIARGRTPSDSEDQPVRTHQHLRSDVEMQHLFRDLPEALANTRLVAERCELELALGVHRVPRFPSDSGRDAMEELRLLSERGACRRYSTTRYQDVPATARARIAHELDVIEEKGLASCFLIVQDVVRYAKEEGSIPVGPGRGNVAGSLVAYVTGVTEIDPLEHGLLFERFLSRTRAALPELDLDVGHRVRDQLMEYVRARLGRVRVAQLSTITRFAGRSAVRAVGRALGIEDATIDSITTWIRSNTAEPIRDALDRSPKLRAAYQSNPQVRTLLEVSSRLEGLPQHPTPWAGGLLLAPDSLHAHVALERGSNGEVVAQATHADAEVLGLMQIHLSGLRYLSVQAETLELVRRHHGKALEPHALALDDEQTFRMLAHGNTNCVFQLEGPGMQALLRELQPSRFDDLVAALSLNRPAPRGSGIVERYVARRRGSETVTWLHEALRPVLEETYGVLLHQEQLMEIAADVAGYDLNEAESLRDVILRQSWTELTPHRSRFLSQALERGLELDAAERIFDLLVAVGGRGASKAHDTAYALLTYVSAFLATHHPLEYIVALLNNSIGQSERTAAILEEAIERQLSILDVDINRSDWRYGIEPRGIRIGLAHIRGLGEAHAESIVEERKRNAEFVSLEEFCSRLPGLPKRVIAGLQRAGAFETLGVDRGDPAVSRKLDRRAQPGPASRESVQLELGFCETGMEPGRAGKARARRRTGARHRAAPSGEPTDAASASPKLFEDGGLEPLAASGEVLGKPGRTSRRAVRRVNRKRRVADTPQQSRLWVVGQIRSRQ
ncbi:MAG: DNA polymerase III subunit alpha [Candidatus Latescibacterota bacterium]|nr:MAG: DNA polymerase III subunit alpha [Candidatus Latescibacterota bacterium]